MRFTQIPLFLALLASSAFAETKDLTVKVGDAQLKLSAPADSKVVTKGAETSIEGKGFWIYLWQPNGPKSVAEAARHVGDVIRGQFVKFTVDKTESIKVAGAPATHLEGKGEEADDNDPGACDVVVFTESGKIFVACVHGERDEAAKQRPALLKVLGSIKGS